MDKLQEANNFTDIVITEMEEELVKFTRDLILPTGKPLHKLTDGDLREIESIIKAYTWTKFNDLSATDTFGRVESFLVDELLESIQWRLITEIVIDTIYKSKQKKTDKKQIESRRGYIWTRLQTT